MKKNNRKMTIEDLAQKMDKEFKRADERIDELAAVTKKGFDELSRNISNLGREISKIKQEISRLPDKLYLSDRIGDLKGDILECQRKVDDKKKLLTDSEVELFKKFELFPMSR